jgi:hypothetical protein
MTRELPPKQPSFVHFQFRMVTINGKCTGVVLLQFHVAPRRAETGTMFSLSLEEIYKWFTAWPQDDYV